MNRMSIVILWALALLVLQPALAAEPRQQPTAREQARTVTIFHQPVVMLQATFGQTTPEERVLRTRSALRAFTEDDIRQPLRVVPVIRYGQPCRLFLMNGKPVLLLSRADLDEGDDLTLDRQPSGCWRVWKPSAPASVNSSTTAICSSPPVKPAGRCCWRCFTTAPSAPGGGCDAFPAADPENAAPYRSTGGAISAILKFDSMLCWSSFSGTGAAATGRPCAPLRHKRQNAEDQPGAQSARN